MWDKPREITDYPGHGFEIAAFASPEMTAAGAVEQWKGSSAHHALILNQDQWSDRWGALGAAVSEHYAVLWFGNEPDPEGPPG
jgi:hypothetical protein